MTRILRKVRKRQAGVRRDRTRLRKLGWMLTGLVSLPAVLALGLSAGGAGALRGLAPNVPLPAHGSGAVAPVGGGSSSAPAPRITTADADIGLSDLDVLPLRPEADPATAARVLRRFPAEPDNPSHECLSVRDHILALRSWRNADFEGCSLVSGAWVDMLSGRLIESAEEMTATPVVPAAEAARSGADAWQDGLAALYLADQSVPWTLVPASRAAERARGGRDPSEWEPEDDAIACRYARAWVAVKMRWGLSVDPDERESLARRLAFCRDAQL